MRKFPSFVSFFLCFLFVCFMMLLLLIPHIFIYFIFHVLRLCFISFCRAFCYRRAGGRRQVAAQPRQRRNKQGRKGSRSAWREQLSSGMKSWHFWGPLAPALPSPPLQQALVRFKPCKMSFYKANCTHFQNQPSLEIGNRDKSSTWKYRHGLL